MERDYDAHHYLANWSTHRVMSAPHTVLPPKVAEQYCVDQSVEAWKSGKHVVLDLRSEDEVGDRVEGAEDALPAIVGVRAELAAGDLRPIYLAWLSAYDAWERDEDAFDDDHDEELEPPVPAGLGSLSAPQRALADLLAPGPRPAEGRSPGESSPRRTRDDATELAAWIAGLPPKDKDKLLIRVVQGQAAQVRMELLRRLRGTLGTPASDRPRRTVAELLDTAAELRRERERRPDAARAAEQARREKERALAREKRLDALAADLEGAWSRIATLIATRKPSEDDTAIELLEDMQAIAQRSGNTDEFAHRCTQLRQEHHRKPSLIQRLDRASLTA